MAYAHVVRGQFLPQVAPQALELPQSPRVSHQLSPVRRRLRRRRLLVVLVDNAQVITSPCRLNWLIAQFTHSLLSRLAEGRSSEQHSGLHATGD